MSAQPPRGGASAGDDFAVFQFTLGIPGFDDNDVPRVAGILAAVLTAVNHVFSQSPLPAAQARTETIALLLAAACVVTPGLGRRLDEAARSGRRAVAELQGTQRGFRLGDSVSGEAAQRELAWATFALLRNANAACVVAWGPGGELLAARGQLPAALLGGEADSAGRDVNNALADAVREAAVCDAFTEGGTEGGGGAVYLSDRGAMSAAGTASLALLPDGAQALWCCPLGRSGEQANEGRLLLVAPEARAFSKKERAWAAAIAAKLGGAL